MTPIDLAVVTAKERIIVREAKLLREIQDRGVSQASELFVQHAMCHAVQNLIGACIDIAQHLLCAKNAEIPGSYAEALEALGRIGVLEPEFARRFSGAAKLRNVVVHAYADLDIDRIAAAVPALLEDTKTFLKAVERHVHE